MPDWTTIHQTHVQPVLEAHAALVPGFIWALAGVAVLVGIALLALLPFPRNLTGLGPLLLVGFGAWAVAGNKRAVENGDVVVRHGVVTDKRVEKFLTTNTTNGASEARLVYVIEVDRTERGILTDQGTALVEEAEHERLTTSATLHGELLVGDELWGISLPTAPDFVHWRIVDGDVRD